MISKLAYLTTPKPGCYVLNIQPEGSDDLLRFEISRAHLLNILMSGAALALREDQFIHRVPATPTEGVEHDRTATGT